jgi:hypothetical protein
MIRLTVTITTASGTSTLALLIPAEFNTAELRASYIANILLGLYLPSQILNFTYTDPSDGLVVRDLRPSWSSSATATLDFPNITTGVSADLTIAVPGAALLSFIEVSAPVLATGLVYSAFVSAPGVVTIRLANVSLAPINPGPQDWRVTVILTS